MDMCLSVLDDDVGIAERAFDMDLTVDGEAVAVGCRLCLHLNVAASPAQCPAADGKDGQDAQEENDAVSDQAEAAAFHATQCSVDGMGYQEKVRYTQMFGRWSM